MSRREELSELLKNKDVSALRHMFETLIKQQQQEEDSEERVSQRQERQLSQGLPELSQQQDGEQCETTFQTNIQPECETSVETICRNVTVTKTRPDIKETCKTRVCQA